MLFPVYASDAWTDLLSVLIWSTNHCLQPNSLSTTGFVLYMLVVCLSQLLCTGGTHPKIPPALYRQNLSTPDLDYWSRFFFFFSFLLGPQHLEIPRLGVKWELQPLAYTTATATIQAESATYTAAHSNARSLTHSVGPGIELTSLCILVRFLSAEPQWELSE